MNPEPLNSERLSNIYFLCLGVFVAILSGLSGLGFQLCITKKQVDELLDAVDRTFTKWEKKIGGKG